MKTIKISQFFLAMVFFTLSLVSCEKADQPIFQPGPSPLKDNFIQDNGPINDTTRNLLVELTSPDYYIVNSNGVLTGTGAKIKIRFFSNKDGYIPSGNYTYASSQSQRPFTYTDATFQISDNTLVNGVFVIYNGTVTVKSDGSAYSILFGGLLSNGYTFSATYNGKMFYSDDF